MHRLDVSGLLRPKAILQIRRALRALAAGERLAVEATDRDLITDLPAFCAQSGHALVNACEREGRLLFEVLRGPDAPTAEAVE